MGTKDKDNIITNQRIADTTRQQALEMRQNMTPSERSLWSELRNNRLDGWHFRRQQIIDGFIVDFYCHKAGLIIEVDGPIHDSQQDMDAERGAVFLDGGLKILRFTNDQVMNEMPSVLEDVRQSLQQTEN